MPTFPCHLCNSTFPNTFQLKQHMLSNTCTGLKKQPGWKEKELYKFDFFGQGTPADISGPLWAKPGFEGGHHAAGGLGSLGVHFLNLKDKQGVVVLKQGDMTAAAEYFCNRLITALGRSAPQIRVLKLSEWELAATAASKAPYSQQGDESLLAETRAQRAGGLLESFAQGYTLKDPRAAEDLKSANGKTLLTQLGEIAAIDMLINNFDRTPLIWDHEGNANNLMFALGKPELIAIDNSTVAILNDEGLAAYKTRVRSVLELAKERKFDAEPFQKIQTFIEAWTSLKIGDEGIGYFQDGLCAMGTKISTFPGLSSIWENTFSQFSGASWGAQGVDSVSLSFVQEVKLVFQEAFDN